MSSWDKALPGCFGNSDLIFAGHPLDENRAFKWLTDLRDRGVGWTDAKEQIVSYLSSQGASKPHIDAQAKKAADRLRPWLFD